MWLANAGMRSNLTQITISFLVNKESRAVIQYEFEYTAHLSFLSEKGATIFRDNFPFDLQDFFAKFAPWSIHYIYNNMRYRKTSNISRTLVGNKIVDNSDVVGASPVGAAPTTSSFST